MVGEKYFTNHEVGDGSENHRHDQTHGEVDEEVAQRVRKHAVGASAVFPGVDGALLHEDGESLQGGEEEERQRCHERERRTRTVARLEGGWEGGYEGTGGDGGRKTAGHANDRYAYCPD